MGLPPQGVPRTQGYSRLYRWIWAPTGHLPAVVVLPCFGVSNDPGHHPLATRAPNSPVTFDGNGTLGSTPARPGHPLGHV